MLKIINQGDLCPLIAVILILCVLGRLITSQRQRMLGVVIGIVGFLVYGGYGLDEFNPRTGDSLFGIALRALLVFGLVMGLSWLILPLLWWALQLIWQRIQVWRAIAAEEAEARKRKAVDQKKTKEEAEAEGKAKSEAEQLKQADELAKAETQKVRKRFDDAKASLILVYEQQGKLIAERLPRERFEELLKKFLDETKPPEEFELRAIQLLNLILGFVNELTPAAAVIPSTDVLAARAETEKFYQERPEIHTVFPPARLQAEIRVRIPDSATAEVAWKEARDMMKEMIDLSAYEKQKNTQQPKFNPPLQNI